VFSEQGNLLLGTVVATLPGHETVHGQSQGEVGQAYGR
jgi:hypothetical protein